MNNPIGSSFVIDTLKSISSPVYNQILGLLLLPIISRMYGSEAFGLLAIVVAIWGPIGPVSTMNYELAIMLPKEEKNASNIYFFSMSVVIFMSLLVAGVLFFTDDYISKKIGLGDNYYFLWFTPMIVLLGGSYQNLRYWNLRNKRFFKISLAEIVGNTSNKLYAIFAGIAGFGTGASLIFAALINAVLIPILLLYGYSRKFYNLFHKNYNSNEAVKILKKYKKFPLVNLPAEFISRLTLSVPIFILAHYFPQSVIGLYFFSLTVLRIPIRFLGNAIGNIFFQRASNENDVRVISSNLNEILPRITFLGLPIFYSFFILGGQITGLVFGEQWIEAGKFLQILSGLMFTRLIVSPLSYLPTIFEKQEFALYLNISILLSTIISFIVGGTLGSVEISLIMLLILESSMMIFFGIILLKSIGIKTDELAKSILLYNIRLVYIFIFHFIINIILGPHHIISLVILVLLTLYYYYYGIRKDQKMYNVIRSITNRISKNESNKLFSIS
ncbi:oligosaccharide flippase family protein [Caldithrix abyssi]|nr:oligosaccharide flippase family protein [Caldithrix abyssi]